MDRGPSKTIQLQLGAGNTLGRTRVRAPLSDRALVLGSRSKGLSKMVQEPRARFHVPEWGAFCHWTGMQTRPVRLKWIHFKTPTNRFFIYIFFDLTRQLTVNSRPLPIMKTSQCEPTRVEWGGRHSVCLVKPKVMIAYKHVINREE